MGGQWGMGGMNGPWGGGGMGGRFPGLLQFLMQLFGGGGMGGMGGMGGFPPPPAMGGVGGGLSLGGIGPFGGSSPVPNYNNPIASYPGGIGNPSNYSMLTGLGGSALLPGYDNSYGANYTGPRTMDYPGNVPYPTIPPYPGGGAYWDYGTSRWITPGSTPTAPTSGGASYAGGIGNYPYTNLVNAGAFTGPFSSSAAALSNPSSVSFAPGGNVYTAGMGAPSAPAYTGPLLDPSQLPPGLRTG